MKTSQSKTNDCLSDVDLTAVAQGEITEADQPAAIFHLGECHRCQSTLDRITGAIAIETELRQLDKTEPDPTNSESMALVITQLTACPRDHQENANPVIDLASILEPDPSGKAALGLFGSYEVIELAGQGGMGAVLKARDPKLDRVVAIKLVSEPNVDLRKRFLLEARSAAALIHENVVTIHAADELNGRPFIVMQYVDGQSLSELIKEQGALSVEQAVEISRQVAAGLAAAHRRGLIHRDIKPENILIDAESGRALLSDFGLVKQIAASSDQDSIENLTRPGFIVGTPRFMSPEQANEQPADVRSDLFSLGSVLYSMCTGKSPFGGDSALKILMQVCEQTPEPIRNINPAIPLAFASIVEKLHQKNPADRFQSSEELLSALAKLNASGEPIAEENCSGSTFAKRNRWGWVAVASVFTAICLFMYGSGNLPFPSKLFSSKPLASETAVVAVTFELISSGDQFASLSEAIEHSQSEDTIEIQGRGPVSLEQVVIGADQTLTLRSPEAATEAATITNANSGPMIIVEGNCTLENVHLRHSSPGGLSRAIADESLQQLRKESSLVVEVGGTLCLTHCELESAPKRVGILHAGQSVLVKASQLITPDGIGVAWLGADESKLVLESSKLDTLVAVAYQWVSGSPHFEMRHCSWIAKADSSSIKLSRLLRVDQDSSKESPLMVKLRNNLLVGNVVVALQGRNSADFLEVTESGNVFSVDALMKNRNHRATSLDEWTMRIGSDSTTSILVPQLSTKKEIQLGDIDWGNETPLKDFGAPQDIGPAN